MGILTKHLPDSQASFSHYQIFYLNAVKNYTGPQVAKMLGVRLAQVYVVRHRIARLIKKEVALIEAERQRI